jgi:hypothetical protein
MESIMFLEKQQLCGAGRNGVHDLVLLTEGVLSTSAIWHLWAAGVGLAVSKRPLSLRQRNKASMGARVASDTVREMAA